MCNVKMRIRVNPDALKPSHRFTIGIAAVFIACLITFSVTAFYYAADVSLGHISPSAQICLSHTWGLNDINAKKYTLHIENTDNLCLTNAGNTSNSMAPTIAPNNILIYKKCNSSELDIGDIIIFEKKDTWIVHRIIGVTYEGFMTKGDNNAYTDNWTVFPNEIRGILVGVLY